jgi:hypothetical protein
MAGLPILSIMTFLPLVGVLIILMIRGEEKPLRGTAGTRRFIRRCLRSLSRFTCS